MYVVKSSTTISRLNIVVFEDKTTNQKKKKTIAWNRLEN